MLIDNYNGLLTSVIRTHLNPILDYEEECLADVLFLIWENIEGFNNKEIDYKRKYISKINVEIDDGIYYIDENLCRLEIQEEINELLDFLGDKDKELFTRYYLNGDKLEEIALDSNTNVTNLHSRLSRGRKKIRNSIFKQESESMIDKFRIFNKVKIDTDKYEEVKTNNDEELKIKMKENRHRFWGLFDTK